MEVSDEQLRQLIANAFEQGYKQGDKHKTGEAWPEFSYTCRRYRDMHIASTMQRIKKGEFFV